MPKLDPTQFFNRELSWLEFNRRVLAEAENPRGPLLERLKFMAIVSSNLDEFFAVRVATVRRAITSGRDATGPDGIAPGQALHSILQKCHKLVDRQYACFDQELLPLMARQGLQIVRPSDYTDADRDFLAEFWEQELFPILTPLAVDPGHPFPLLNSGAVYLFFQVRPLPPPDPGQDHPGGAPSREQPRFFRQTDAVLVQSPAGRARLVRLPSPRKELRLAVINDVISLFAPTLLSGYEVVSAMPFRVIRDAELDVDEDVDNLISAVEAELQSRRWGAPLRLKLWRQCSPGLAGYLQERLALEDDTIFRIPSLLDLTCLFQLGDLLDRPDLRNPPWPPQPHPGLAGGGDVFAAIREQDHLLHHPYHSFEPVVRLLQQAALDPDVLAIKMTLYRVSGDSPIVKALILAAESGKQVTALVELRARFDEQANIAWARRLESAGAHVIYGVIGYKTHAKACLVIRREPDGLKRYVHLGTGNYNDRTAQLYTDLGYLTARPNFGADVSAFFNVITGYSLPPRFRRIVMAPTQMREHLLTLIEREIEKHSKETPGLIRAKLNSLIDPEIIQALYRASAKGVRVELIVRGMCRLRPGVKGLSDQIAVRSIVDRYLEHSRIVHFRNGGQDEYYLSSADWMERNFDGRLELLFPVLDPAAIQEVAAVLDAALADNSQAWQLLPDGSYRRLAPPAKGKVERSQSRLYRRACKSTTARTRARAHPAIFQPRRQPKK